MFYYMESVPNEFVDWLKPEIDRCTICITMIPLLRYYRYKKDTNYWIIGIVNQQMKPYNFNTCPSSIMENAPTSQVGTYDSSTLFWGSRLYVVIIQYLC